MIKSQNIAQIFLIYLMLFSIFVIKYFSLYGITLYEILFSIILITSIKKIKIKNDFLNITNIALLLLVFVFLLKILLYGKYVYEFLVISFLSINYYFFCNSVINKEQKVNMYEIIKNGFILIFITSSILVFIFYTLNIFDIFIKEVWHVKNVIYPYLNKKTIHFEGFFPSSNYQAYVMIPGFFYILEDLLKKNNKFIIFLFLSLSLIVFFIIKVKILLLIFLLAIFLILNKYVTINKIFFYLLLVLIFFTYSFITHLIISNVKLDGSEFKFYFTEDPLFVFNNLYIYGSFFLKIKLYIINNFEFISLLPLNRNFYVDYGFKPHSVYFGLLYNYGFLSLIFFLTFIINIIYMFNRSYFKFNKKIILIDFIIFIIFLFEGLNLDLVSYRFFWISTAMFSGIILLQTKTK